MIENISAEIILSKGVRAQQIPLKFSIGTGESMSGSIPRKQFDKIAVPRILKNIGNGGVHIL